MARIDGELRTIAASAVVLGCGGFEANPEMRARYLGPGWELAKVRGTRYLPGSRWYWLWPTADCLPTAVWAELSRAPQRLKHLFGVQQLPIEIRWSEPQEFYFALFLALFLASLWYRLNGREHPPGQDPR